MNDASLPDSFVRGNRHDEIAAFARDLWEQDGRPVGRDLDYWLQAEWWVRETRTATGVFSHVSETTAGLKPPQGVVQRKGPKRSARKVAAARSMVEA